MTLQTFACLLVLFAELWWLTKLYRDMLELEQPINDALERYHGDAL